MTIDYNHSDEYTEESIHHLILDFPQKFGIKEIKQTSFHSTPDFFAIDSDNNKMGIELELCTSSFAVHLHQIQHRNITHCFYLYDDWKDTPGIKRPTTIKFVKLKLDENDLHYLDTEIYDRLEIQRAIKHMIDTLCMSNYNQKDFKNLDILINQYFLEFFGKTINEIYKERNTRPTFVDIRDELFKLPKEMKIRLVLDYNKYLEAFFSSRPIFLSSRIIQ